MPDFVNRVEELKQLESLFTETVNGKGKFVLLSGSLGSGKSAIIREFCSRIENKNVVILKTLCTADSHEPFKPFKDLLGEPFFEENIGSKIIGVYISHPVDFS